MNARVPMLDLKRQYASIRHEIEPAVQSCLESGVFIQGPQVREFEREAAEYLQVRHAVSVGNGTDALVIALRAAGIRAGDEVITSPFTFFATAEAIVTAGGVPVFADILEDSFNLDPQSVKKKITSKTRAILPVHIFGQPAGMDELLELSAEHGLKIIEDACQAIGAEYHGKKVGGIGDAGCFSFFPTKNLGAFGDGGLITTNDDNIASVCRALREHGGGRNGASAVSILGGGLPVEEQEAADPLYNPYKYYNYILGYNSRLDALQAAVLRVKLHHLDEWNLRRAENAAYYRSHLENSQVIPPKAGSGVKHVWHQFAVRTPYKNQLGKYLESRLIASGVFYPVPLHLQKAFEYLGYREGDLPMAEKVSSQTVCLPIFPDLTRQELDDVIEAVRSFHVAVGSNDE
ncbi:MAG TPA: DegT/DnrJ/EryC1/StrS family aminotransferase [Clostridia bacterium]|nr:DegT/DnrJ/EryC1/StrS family aminotransferase [Clostridia bacterium]